MATVCGMIEDFHTFLLDSEFDAVNWRTPGICRKFYVYPTINVIFRWFSGNSFVLFYFNYFYLFIYCLVVVIFYLMHDVEAISPSVPANSIWKSFMKYE